MKKVRISLAVLLAATTLLTGCGRSISHQPGSSEGRWWRNHLRGYWYVIERDFTDLYRTFDRHVFNYDWDDPYLD